MSEHDHDLNTAGKQVCNSCGHDRSVLTDEGTEKRCAECDVRWPGKVPPDPAVKAAKEINDRVCCHSSIWEQIIRAAYAEQTAECERLRAEVEHLQMLTQADARTPIPDGPYQEIYWLTKELATARDESLHLSCKCEELQLQLDAARADIADCSQRKQDQDAELSRIAGELHAAREMYRSLRS